MGKNKIEGKRNSAALRSWLPLLISYLICFSALMCGIVCTKKQLMSDRTVRALFAFFGLAPLLLTAIFRIADSAIGKRYKKMSENVAEMQAFLLSHREDAIKSARKELACLLKLRGLVTVWAAFLGISALGVTFFAGCFAPETEWSVLIIFYAVLLLNASLTELIRPTVKRELAPEGHELSRGDHPILYSLAEKAQKRTGGKEKIRILWGCSAENPIGITSIDDTVLILLDVIVLNLFTEEELYAVLLHEFEHVDPRNRKKKAIARYARYLDERAGRSDIIGMTENLLYRLFRDLFQLHHFLYSFASSIETESSADSMMKECPLAAATALLKLQYYSFYDREMLTDTDVPPVYLPETPPEMYYSDILARFHSTFSRRREFWNGLIPKEIQSRGASHPTIRSRVCALVGEELPAVTEFPSGVWLTECGRVLAAADASMLDSFGNERPCYEEERSANYLEPLSRIHAWEEGGKKVAAEEYGDILTDLYKLGRVREALELADRAIAELPLSASHMAYYFRGYLRLELYDPAGLDDIYTAMEANNNYIEEGLNMIGNFCCMMGLQEELEVYREKALALSQKYHDESMQIDAVSRKDVLSEEHLPDGVLEDILAYIDSAAEGKVEKVYLFRKTVSENFFSSSFVLEFSPDADEMQRGRIYHRVFTYLDTSSDWQYSLYVFSDIPAGILDKNPSFLVWQRTERKEEPLS